MENTIVETTNVAPLEPFWLTMMSLIYILKTSQYTPLYKNEQFVGKYKSMETTKPLITLNWAYWRVRKKMEDLVWQI